MLPPSPLHAPTCLCSVLRQLFSRFETEPRRRRWHLLLVCLVAAASQSLKFSPTGLAAELASPTETLEQLRDAAEQKQSAQVLQLASSLLDHHPVVAEAYYWRGREHLRQGQAQQALDDFDRYLQANPAAQARLWERGIACFYAEEYQEGVRQFESYQTYDDNDVENAIWHALCQAHVTNWPDAQSKLMKVRRDARIPMAEIYRLFAGELQPADVLAAADVSDEPRQRDVQRFYAHLYLGLYYETQRETGRAREHLQLAAERYRIDHYMGDVAQMHYQRSAPLAPSPSKSE